MTHNSINNIISAVLAIAIIVLFVLQLGNKQKEKGRAALADVPQDTASILSFAYINVDSLLLNYYLAVDLRGQIVVQEENARSIITQHIRELEYQMRRYKQSLEENPFISREQSDAEYNRILKRQHEIYELENQLTKELKDEQDRVYQQLYDSIILQIKRYNEVKKISIIFSNTDDDNILFAKDSYNATREVIDYLNEKFTKPSLQQ